MVRRLDVDGLRTLAILPVLLFHFGLPGIPGGFTGVDIFFVISGFVVARSIIVDIDQDRFSIARFYFKRIRRLFPALFVTLVVTTIAATILLLPGDLIDYAKSLSATALFGSNFYFWKTSGYFEVDAAVKPLLHTWSLAVEEQYYLFAPLLMAIIFRFGREKWRWFVMPIFVLSLMLSIAAVFLGPTGGYFLLPTRTWELMLGMAIALADRNAPASRPLREGMAFSGLCLIAGGILFIDRNIPYPGWNALFPTLGTALIIQAGIRADPLPLINRILTLPVMVGIGTMSYALYLVHWPIAALTTYRTLQPPTTVSAFIMLGASFALAGIVWRFVERPCMTIDWSAHKKVFVSAALGSALVAATGIALVAGNGWPARYPDLNEPPMATNEGWGGETCFNEDANKRSRWNAAACTRIHGKAGRILLWGDSFSAHYTPGIVQDAARINADVLQYSFAGCPPILAYRSLGRIACQPANEAVFDIIREQKIDTVVLAARWTEASPNIIADLHETIDALKKTGVRVVVIGQSPAFIAKVTRIDYLSGQRSNRARGTWPAKIGAINTVLRKQVKGAEFIDPMRYLCNPATCPYRIGDQYLYNDYGHFSPAGSYRAVHAYFPAGKSSK